MALKKDLLDILACPKCKGELLYREEESGLVCNLCKLMYPVKEDIPVLLVEEAEAL